MTPYDVGFNHGWMHYKPLHHRAKPYTRKRDRTMYNSGYVAGKRAWRQLTTSITIRESR